MATLAELGSVPQATATIIAAWIALRISRNWRAALIGKRRQEVAEEILVTVYRFRAAMVEVRRCDLTEQEKLDFGSQTKADSYDVSQERFKRNVAVFNDLERQIPLADIYYDGLVADNLLRLKALSDRVKEAAENLRKHGENADFAFDHAEQIQLWQQEVRDLRVLLGDVDPTTDQMKNFVRKAERDLKQHLKLPNDPDAPPHWRDTARDLSPVWLFGRNGIPHTLFRIVRLIWLNARSHVARRRKDRGVMRR